MPAIGGTTTQQVLDEIEKLKSTIESFGESARTKLTDIKKTEIDVRAAIPLTPAGKIDDTVWSKKDDKERNIVHSRLLQIRDALRSTASLDGSIDESHLMHESYASNWSIVAWLLTSFVIVGILLSIILCRWGEATSSDFTPHIQNAEAALKELADAQKKEAAFLAEEARKTTTSPTAVSDDSSASTARNGIPSAKPTELENIRTEIEISQRKANEQAVEAIQAIEKGGASEQTVLSMVMLLGALGGSLHLVTSLVMYIGNGQLKRRWLPYYLSLPVAGAALAPIVYMLLRVGILTPTGTTNGTSGTSNLNLVGIYAFAALTGMFAKTATDKLSEVFSTLFRTGEQPGKDKMNSGKAS